MKSLFENKFGLFGAAGALGGVFAFFLYTAWFAIAPATEAATWTLGPLRANSTYVVGIGVMAIAVSMILAMAQASYTGAARPVGQLLRAAAVATSAGVLGGFLASHLGQIAFESEDPARFLGWTIGCSGVGVAVAMCVINMPKASGLVGGAIAGLVGCAAHYASSGMGVNVLLVGLVTAGAISGLVLAFIERNQRQAWLEVVVFPEGKRDEGRTVELSLGATPVRLGYAKGADIRLEAIPNAPQMFAEVRLAKGAVEFHDLVARRVVPMAEGATFGVSNAELRLRRKSATTA